MFLERRDVAGGLYYPGVLGGRSCSIEIMGCRSSYIPLQVTDLEMDEKYDCRRVVAPSDLDTRLVEQFRKYQLKLPGWSI